MNIIENKIKDRRFTSLIWKTLRAGYFEFHEVKNSIVGTPQGSIISPLLANIYLHPLDQFMEKRITGYNRGTAAKINPEYKRLEYYQAKAAKRGDNKGALRILKQRQLLLSRLKATPDFRRMYYVRYADDWIVSLRGPRKDAVQLLHAIKDFLKEDLKLDLSLGKTKITRPRDAALFLGTEISNSNHVYAHRGKQGQYLRAPSQIRMIAPLHRIYKKLTEAGFMNGKHEGTPRFLWKDLSKDTIITLYNSVLRGYLNYYSFAHNYNNRTAASLTHILKVSCAKLLGAKLSLGSTSKVFKKFGSNLTGNDKAAFLNPSLKLNTWDFKVNAREYLNTLYASHLSAATLENLACRKCGSVENVEMHHVRKLSDLNPKISEIDRIMVKARRKQVPLCRACHLEHHKKESPWKSSQKATINSKNQG
uniref:hypothetical protein n=1 Tax=Agaricus bitorquis TaxID=5343 RepID=UPI0027A15A0E|nr:hypothetical protein QLP03_mgp066 [Agaricus bitorquis]WFG54002.1 hypothetical protein [Agaricus bitorquis]